MSKDSKKPKIPEMAQLVMKWSSGKIKEPEEADNVLLGFSVFVMCVSFILVSTIGRGPHIPLPPGTKVVYPSNEPPRLVKLLASVISNENESKK